jgi:hypothetical protein
MLVDHFINAFSFIEGHFLEPITSPFNISKPESVLSLPPSSLSKSLPLNHPFHVLLLVLFYIAAIGTGIQIMKKREKFTAKRLAFVHNLFSMSLSLYMCLRILQEAFTQKYRLIGNPVNKSENGVTVRIFFSINIF